jgi:hypothetical protein
MKHKNSGFTAVEIVAGVALVALIGVGGFYAYQNYSSSNTNSSSTNKENYTAIKKDDTASQSSTPLPSASPIPAAAEWVTYTSEPEGLKVKYPSNWKLEKLPPASGKNYDSFTIKSPNKVAINVRIRHDVVDGGFDCYQESAEGLTIPGSSQKLYISTQGPQKGTVTSLGISPTNRGTDCGYYAFDRKNPAPDGNNNSKDSIQIWAGIYDVDGPFGPSIGDKTLTPAQFNANVDIIVVKQILKS